MTRSRPKGGRLGIRALALALGLSALANVAPRAHAASTLTLDASQPGGAKTSWSGAALTGTSDPLGPPSNTACDSQTCERKTVTVVAPDGYASANNITLTVGAKSTKGGDGLDIAILDAKGNLLASQSSGVDPATTSASYLTPGVYTIEVDGDTGDGDTYTGTAAVSSLPIKQQAAQPTGALTFGRETIADPLRTGTEPDIITAPDGTIYESPIFGFSTTLSFLDRSTDGGKTFATLGVPTAFTSSAKTTSCPGGGDSELQTDPQGNVYFIDLGGAPVVPAAVSSNKGDTFTSQCLANDQQNVNNFPDRQWLSTDTVNGREWYIYRDGVTNPGSTPVDSFASKAYGEYIKYSSLPNGPATSSQLNFTSLCSTSAGLATPCMTDVSIAGNAVTDNSTDPTDKYAGTTYLAFSRGDGISVAAINPKNTAAPFVEHTAVKGATQILFPTVAVDKAGTIYEAYTDSGTYQVMLTRSTDGGAHWTPPAVVNGAPAQTTVMPWIVAGDAGRIDLVFYGSPNVNAPTTNNGPWNVYMIQSLDADSATPHYTQNVVTDRPNHVEPICLSGLGCTTNTGPAGDRNLGDFFRVALDSSGRAVISFADGNNRLGTNSTAGAGRGGVANPSLAEFVQQASGPSLFTKVGNVPAIDVPTGSVSVAPHTVNVPVNAAVPANNAALALTGSRVTQVDANTLAVHLDVANLDPAAAITPPAGPVATYLTRWNDNGSIYYAAAEDVGGQWRYFAGEAAPVSTSGVKFVYYPATTTVTGTVTPGKNGTIDITVPTSAVGGAAPGGTLYSVTGYTFSHASPTLPNPPSANENTDLPTIADVLPAYNTTLSSATVGLPEIHRPVLLVGGLLLLGLAVAPGRRYLRRLAR